VFWDFEFHDLEPMDFVAATCVHHAEAGVALEEQRPPGRFAVFDDAVPLAGAVMPILGELDRADGDHDADDAECDVLDEVVTLFDHQLLGASRDVQGPVLDEVGYWFEKGVFPETRALFDEAQTRGEGWTLLGQIESRGEMLFGDMGALYLVMPTEDLPARRFDRVMGIMQCS
jgi:hypothetical protein